jgi:hypothetical protein
MRATHPVRVCERLAARTQQHHLPVQEGVALLHHLRGVVAARTRPCHAEAC